MKKSKEITRLHIHGDLSYRNIAKIMNLFRPVISRIITRWKDSGLAWEELQELPDSQFHELLYPRNTPPGRGLPQLG